MKRTMSAMLILTVLSFWIPCASAEISQDLDPMASPDSQTPVAGESSVANVSPVQSSTAMSANETSAVEKKTEEAKKEKSKKSSKKKSTEKKKAKKSSSKSSRKHKKSSN